MSHNKLQQNISRLMALLLCLMLVLPCVPAARAAEGSCGSDLTWSFDGATLTVSGSGAMRSYSEESPAPWHSFRSQITRLVLPEGLTRIGSWAFAECTGITAVTIPESVEVIDQAAFLGCTAMTVLNLNNGLRTIGVCAFEQCRALADLRLPGSLINLKDHAFYMCESLSYVTVPAAVRTIGSGVFSYCSNLIRADVYTSAQMPKWSFYGCDKLEIVTVQGNSVDPESLKISTPPQGIGSGDNSETSTPAATESVPGPAEGAASSTTVTTDASGAEISDRTVVTKNENSTTVSSTKTASGQQDSTVTEITATVHNDKGWQDVIDKVNSATLGGNSETVNVTVYLTNDESVKSEILDKFAGKNVLLKIQTATGSQYAVDCDNLESGTEEELTLSYSIVPAEDVPSELQGYVVYSLTFHASTQIKTEVVVRLPGGHSLSTANLYRLSGDTLNLLQSVLVDGDGNAHWYLANVDAGATYLIGIDVPGGTEESPVIPAELHDVYKVENVYDGVEYVVTGRTSSWNMSLGQVMGILAVVMITVIAVVGVVMYIWNKKRLQGGYVPRWDDEE